MRQEARWLSSCDGYRLSSVSCQAAQLAPLANGTEVLLSGHSCSGQTVLVP